MAPPARLDTNVLYCDDNLSRLAQFPGESVDLAYLDPPFFSNRTHTTTGGEEGERRSFDDRWAGDIGAYIGWMRERMVELHRVLKPTGSVYVHCDWHASHYLKVMLDGVFGAENFLNNVVWCYGLGGSSDRYWPRKHDDILWYAKAAGRHSFEADRVPATSQRMKGEDKKAPDYWDIPTVNNMAHERLGYPTQKPEALLARIVRSSSREDDVVLDPFAGSGTALVAAHRLGRRWIGIDASPVAVELARRRLEAAGADSVPAFGLAPADGSPVPTRP